MDDKSFTIWIESELYANGAEEEDFMNVEVTFASGPTVGLNIWSYDFFVREIGSLGELEEDYFMPPDLVVKDMSRAAVRRVISNLVQNEKWIEGRGLSQILADD